MRPRFPKSERTSAVKIVLRLVLVCVSVVSLFAQASFVDVSTSEEKSFVRWIDKQLAPEINNWINENRGKSVPVVLAHANSVAHPFTTRAVQLVRLQLGMSLGKSFHPPAGGYLHFRFGRSLDVLDCQNQSYLFVETFAGSKGSIQVSLSALTNDARIAHQIAFTHVYKGSVGPHSLAADIGPEPYVSGQLQTSPLDVSNVDAVAEHLAASFTCVSANLRTTESLVLTNGIDVPAGQAAEIHALKEQLLADLQRFQGVALKSEGTSSRLVLERTGGNWEKHRHKISLYVVDGKGRQSGQIAFIYVEGKLTPFVYPDVLSRFTVVSPRARPYPPSSCTFADPFREGEFVVRGELNRESPCWAYKIELVQDEMDALVFVFAERDSEFTLLYPDCSSPPKEDRVHISSPVLYVPHESETRVQTVILPGMVEGNSETAYVLAVSRQGQAEEDANVLLERCRQMEAGELYRLLLTVPGVHQMSKRFQY